MIPEPQAPEVGGGLQTAPVPSSPVLALLRNRRFLRLWVSQIISNLGDWAYIIAVEISLAGTLDGPALVRATALLFGVEGLTSALVGMTIAGPLADRFSRVRVMVIADVIRALAVATLLLQPQPEWTHVVAIAAVLGAFRSMFHPALMATVPAVVPERSLVVANGVMSSTFHLAIMVGPPVGGLLVASFGARAAIVLNAASFGISGLLLARMRMRSASRDAGERGPFTPLADVKAGFRYLVASRTARGIAIVMGLALMLLASQGAFQMAFISAIVAPGGDQTVWAAILGAMLTAFGVSMVAGSALTPLLSRWISARGLLVGALGLAGCAFVLASSSSAVPPVVVAWGMSGLAGGIINVTYETLLQIDTPDAFRGRVFAAVESIQEAAYVIGAALVATFAIGVSPSTALLTVGVAFFGCSLIAMMLLPGEAMLAEAEPVG